MLNITTKTAQHARDRILQARIGSLAGHPSTEYLDKLEREIRDWLEVIARYREEAK